ncbi:MAG: response regulator [Bdellovibrionota bacterium]
MASVLVVEDTPDYCAEIAAVLEREGHQVRSATGSREAIAIGCTFRPDVLVTDWLLNEEMNGIEISNALRLVYPELRTIVITGFASDDLRRDVERSDVFAFLEKPFHLAEIRDSVNRASQYRQRPSRRLSIAVFEATPEGRIVYGNPKFEDLVRALPSGRGVATVDELFGVSSAELMHQSAAQWVETNPAADTTERWLMRSWELSPAGLRLVVVLDRQSQIYRSNFTVLQLLDIAEQTSKIEGNLLLVDDLESVRMVTRDLLRRLSTNLHTASTHREALRLFIRDGEIRIVVIDYDMPDGTPRELINVMRSTRPDVKIIGTSAVDHAASFKEFGVHLFIPKPWSVAELMTTLSLTN